MEEALRDAISRRLQKTGAPERLAHVVLAAFEGKSALAHLLDQGIVPQSALMAEPRAPVGAYVTSLTVEGFRGIGPPTTLELTAGPGLTLVIGRNGSGKSSFAEALEVLFTGDNQRWARRSAVWRESWRNLHHPAAVIEASLAIEGISGPSVVRRDWDLNSGLDDGTVVVQPHGLKKTTLDFLGWDEALPMFRPFLSYSELGSMLDEGPSKLHDAVSAVLGLDELSFAEKALRDARLERQKAKKEVLEQRNALLQQLEGLDDPRAGPVVAALRRPTPDLDVMEGALSAPPDVPVGQVGLLQRVLAVDVPDPALADAAADELRSAVAEVAELAGTESDELMRAADLIEQALAFRDSYPSEACPVCETPGVITQTWVTRAKERLDEQRAVALASTRARKRLIEAMRKAKELVGPVPQAIRDAGAVLDTGSLIEAWRSWLMVLDEDDPMRIAEALESVRPVATAIVALKAAATDELKRREDAWRPVAAVVQGWITGASPALARARGVADLKKGEAWLKAAAVDIRNERFAPIADEAMAIWELLRQRSNVELGRIEFEGSGTRRRVTLDVTIDGVKAAALGVMSQGELHSLALSLFFPRATLAESPFRFVVIDDPVQSMDPAKVDGLAQVLARAAQTRQVVVFTHDDRLPEAVRRLRIDANVIEVSRKENSVVELRSALSPIERYLEDARALVRTTELPEDVGRRVVPGYCRLALEAACIEAIRRRRITRGDAHADVENLLGLTNRLTVFAALALFDDGNRGGDVLPRISSEFGGQAANAFQAINKGVHEPTSRDLRDLVRDAGILARQLAEAA
jgi:energy-coupling factor transporter ATP-binding protein EcfA2